MNDTEIQITREMNLCGCFADGVPEFITDALEDPRLPAVQARCVEDPGLAAEVILHWMDHFGWLEHGTSIRYSWPADTPSARLDLFRDLVLDYRDKDDA